MRIGCCSTTTHPGLFSGRDLRLTTTQRQSFPSFSRIAASLAHIIADRPGPPHLPPPKGATSFPVPVFVHPYLHCLRRATSTKLSDDAPWPVSSPTNLFWLVATGDARHRRTTASAYPASCHVTSRRASGPLSASRTIIRLPDLTTSLPPPGFHHPPASATPRHCPSRFSQPLRWLTDLLRAPADPRPRPRTPAIVAP